MHCLHLRSAALSFAALGLSHHITSFASSCVSTSSALTAFTAPSETTLTLTASESFTVPTASLHVQAHAHCLQLHTESAPNIHQIESDRIRYKNNPFSSSRSTQISHFCADSSTSEPYSSLYMNSAKAKLAFDACPLRHVHRIDHQRTLLECVRVGFESD